MTHQEATAFAEICQAYSMGHPIQWRTRGHPEWTPLRELVLDPAAEYRITPADNSPSTTNSTTAAQTSPKPGGLPDISGWCKPPVSIENEFRPGRGGGTPTSSPQTPPRTPWWMNLGPRNIDHHYPATIPPIDDGAFPIDPSSANRIPAP